LKKELEFVETQIDHFDRSFAEEMKQFKEAVKKSKQINYGTFKIDEKIDPYTVSPFSRDYHGNCKGANNINIYRPDSLTSPLKSNKSLSRSKYNILRNVVHDLTLSKKQLNVYTDYEQKDEGQGSKQDFFRRGRKFNKDEYGLYTMGQPASEGNGTFNKTSALKLLRTSTQKKSLSKRNNLTRFKTETCLD
jgi:hypothetical protein